MITLTEKEQQRIDTLLADSPTRCFGVYLIDLPIPFKWDEGMSFYYQQNSKVKIHLSSQYLPPFRQMITLREQELKETLPNNPKNGDYLRHVYPLLGVKDEVEGVIFERVEDINSPDVFRTLEGYRWQDEVTLKIEIEANNGLASRYDEDRVRSPNLYGNNVPEKLAEMEALFERIQPRDDLTIPTLPGQCLLHGFMSGIDYEWKDFGYGYSHESDEMFSISLRSDNYSPDYALLDKPEAAFTEYKGKTIYKGTRETNGLALEEWIVKGRYFGLGDEIWGDEQEGYMLYLGINMTNPTEQAPKLNVEMYYKIPKDGSGYSEAELMVIWREITNTIRLRPGAFG